MSTGGEGGMVTTNDESLWSSMWSRKDHGKCYKAVYEIAHPPGFRWLQNTFGTNMRMIEIQAVIGRIQLKRLPEWTARRQANSKAIHVVAAEFDVVRSVEVPSHLEHACYRHYLFVNLESLAENWTRDRIVEEVIKLGVPCYHGACPEVYLEKAFDDTGWRPDSRLPNAQELGETNMMFLVHPTLTSAEIQKTCVVLKQVLSAAQRIEHQGTRPPE